MRIGHHIFLLFVCPSSIGCIFFLHDLFVVLKRIYVQSLLDQKIAAAESLSDIYDERNEFHEELVEEVLQEALQQALAQDGQRVTRDVTLKLVNREGRWWVVPHQNLLQILTGLA